MEKKRQVVIICDVKHMFQSTLVIFCIFGAVATTAFYYVTMDEQGITSTEQATIRTEPATTPTEQATAPTEQAMAPTEQATTPTVVTANVYDRLDGCDLFSGKWVHDKESYPLYKEGQCPYITGDFACGEHGRMDSKYQQWRWKPHACNLPRFDAKEVLERLRGKRVIFIGDSVNRNQWVSMVCMLQTVIPIKSRKMQKVHHVSLMTFRAFEYNLSIDFYWAPLLVESNADHPVKHKTKDRIVSIESIENHAKHWVNVDVLVFNSYLWWRMPTVKILKGSLKDSKQYNVVENHKAYSMVMKVWANWLHNHVNHSRTQLYFMSMTATHHSGKEWGMKRGQNCFSETEPITKYGFWESGSDLKMMRILESSLNRLRKHGVNVQVVNITQLTQYRKDAHPSIHKSFTYNLTTTQLVNPSSYADCTHWCVPGVPDVWNELLLAYILRGHK